MDDSRIVSGTDIQDHQCEIKQTLAEKESEVLSLIISNNEAHAGKNIISNLANLPTNQVLQAVQLDPSIPDPTTLKPTEFIPANLNKVTTNAEQADATECSNFVAIKTNVIENAAIEEAGVPVKEKMMSENSSLIAENDSATKTVENELTEQEISYVDENQKIINIDSDGTATIEFNAADASWITLLDKFEYILNEDRIRGYIDGEKNFLCLWERFQTSTMSSFCVRSSDKFYKNAEEGDESVIHGRVLKGAAKWSRLPLVPYDGVPFVFMDRKYFGCRYGGPERRNRHKGMLGSSRNGHSLKVGCPAEAEVVEVWRVPELMLSDKINSKREKRRVKQKLLSQVHSYILLEKFTRRYYVTLPLISNHQNHPVLDLEAGRLKYLHPRIIEKIYEYVNQGIYEKQVIKYMLGEFVQEFQSELDVEIRTTDRSFYPTDRDISNHVRNARKANKREDLASVTDAVANKEALLTVGNEVTYNTEVVSSTLPEIIVTNEVDYLSSQGNGMQDNRIITDNTGVVSTPFTHDATTFDENVDTSSYIANADVGTVAIDGIIPSDVMEYYQSENGGATSIDSAMKLLLDPCKRKAKKREGKWPLKPSKFNRKQRDLKILLREEIQKSFAVMNVAIQEEVDESKLHNILKKVKSLQHFVEGRSSAPNKRSGRRRTGIHAMVHLGTDSKDL